MSAPLLKAMNMGLDAIYSVIDKPALEDKNILEQRREAMYYYIDHPAEVMRAVNDHIDPNLLRRFWSANDGTEILSMLDKALIRHMVESGYEG